MASRGPALRRRSGAPRALPAVRVAGIHADLDQPVRSLMSRLPGSAPRLVMRRLFVPCRAALTPPSPQPSCTRLLAISSTCVFVDHGLLRQGEREQVGAGLRRRNRASNSLRSTLAQRSSMLLSVSPIRKRSVRSSAASSSASFEQAQPDLVAESAEEGEPIKLPRSGHPVPGRCRVGRGRWRREHQEPPQRWRPAGRS